MIKLRPVSLLLAETAVLLLAGCNRTEPQINRTRQRLEHVELFMSKSEVIATMGSPHKREVFLDERGEPIEVLLYETEYTYSGPVPDSAFTPVVLRSGQVIGWGRNMYDRTRRYHIEQDITVNDKRQNTDAP